MVELRAKVFGQVQAVGFRSKARSIARQLDLKGIVRNLPDGSVEIVAQGKKEVLYHLSKITLHL